MNLLLNLNKHIASLLHFHNYVVVPGLGGFIAKEQSALLNPQGNIITPPRKELVFNPALHTGDGLLLQELVKLEGLSYQLAEKAVTDTVTSWMSLLDLGRTLQLEGIGQLRKNMDDKIVFRQYSHSNFLTTSFGLEVATVSTSNTYHGKSALSAQLTEPQTIVIEQLPVNYKRFRVASLAAIVFLTVSATYLFMLNFTPVLVEEAGLNFFKVPVLSQSEISDMEATKKLLQETEDAMKQAKSSTATTLKSNTNDVAVPTAVSTEENEPIDIESITVAPPVTPEEQTAIEPVQNLEPTPVAATTPTETEASSSPQTTEAENQTVTTPTEEKTYSNLFHVIVSSVTSSDQINAELERFRLKGYEPIVLSTDAKSYRISIGGFGTKDSASTFKTNIKNDNDISSWILTPKQ